ncbi:MAG TPA: hypothetical protein P5531_14575 [Bacteroidales bacterium]|nr:hypothetical protein [Bacteroidales bacterium]HSA44802.1 hypothetical protein [Bacteroidales bacterium]
MKKQHAFGLFLLAFSGFSFMVNATVLRVNSAPGSATPYTSVQAAHDAASNDDTLYVESSSISYGTLTCTKKLTIIGTGYFLAQNPQTQASPSACFIQQLYFNAGSQGSKITGVYLNTIILATNDILITRCYIYGNNAIYVNTSNPIGNIVITQNFIDAGYTYHTAINFSYPANNVLISNNYIRGYLSTGTNFFGIITNNVVDGVFSAYNAVLKNNIMLNGSFNNYNCIYFNNIGHNQDFGTQNGNQSNVNMSTVFLGSSGNSSDGQWQLKTGSPAIGAGEGGVDCGMFGGSLPYILSGMPNIPAIYYMNAPSIPSNTINVSIKAKSHN